MTTDALDLDDDLTAGDDDQAAAEPENVFPDVFAFVEFLADLYAHEVSEQQSSWRWCPRWFDHATARARLEAMWRAFEALTILPGVGASVWFRDHADPCMNFLTAADGPFSRCSDERHTAAPALPLATPPAALLAVASPLPDPVPT